MSATPTFADWDRIRTQFEQRLGRLTIEFAKLEVDLGCAIGSLVSTDVRVGHSVSSELSFKAKLALLTCPYRGSTDVALHEDLDSWRKAAEQVEAERNRLIHSFYWPDSSAPQLVRYKATARQKGLQFQTEPVTVEDLDDILHKLKGVVLDLIALMMPGAGVRGSSVASLDLNLGELGVLCVRPEPEPGAIGAVNPSNSLRLDRGGGDLPQRARSPQS